MKLILLPNPILRKKSQKVVFPLSNKDIKLAEVMIEHINNSKKTKNAHRIGVGISAIQFGELKRMFYINIEENVDKPFKDLLINPVVLAWGATSMALKDGEGCLSVPENWKKTIGLVHRKAKIVIKGYSYLQKKEVEYSKFGYQAIVIQHELDHLNGVLFIDRINQENKWQQEDNEILL